MFSGTLYISSKRAAKELRYTKDYVGQLCRARKVDAKLVGRTWYVNRDALYEHRAEVERQWREMGSAEKVTRDNEYGLEQNTDDASMALSATHRGGNVSHRADMRPIPLEDFAMTRMPTRLEIERKMRQDSLMSTMDVSYERDVPLYFEDERPLNPEPYKVVRFDDAPVSVSPPMRYQERTERDTVPRFQSGAARQYVSAQRRDTVDGVILSPLRPHQVRVSARGGHVRSRNSPVYDTAHCESYERPRKKHKERGKTMHLVAAGLIVVLSLVGAYMVLTYSGLDTVSPTTASLGDVGFLSTLVDFFE